jgi:hypothetical protein
MLFLFSFSQNTVIVYNDIEFMVFHKILTSPQLGLKTDADGVQRVKGELRKLDIDLCYNEVDDSQPAINLSGNLRNHILWAVRSRNASSVKNGVL